jgi:Flp pilus assembly pilin Flp
LSARHRLAESDRAEEQNPMTKLIDATLKLKIWKDNRGQDLVEYALLAGFLVAASVYTLPQVATSVSNILSTVVSMMSGSGSDTAPGA